MAVVVMAGLFGGCGSDGAEPTGGSGPDDSAATPAGGVGVGNTVAGFDTSQETGEVRDRAAAASDSGVAATDPRPASPPPTPARDVDTAGAREFPSSAVWAALRQCQSQGDYGLVDSSGQYFGAYQFTVGTWDRLATQRYPDLLGVLPSEATPEDQDRMARYLWLESDSARWPACRHVFTGDFTGEPSPGGTDVDGTASPAPPPAAEAGTDSNAGGENPPPPPAETDTGGDDPPVADLPSLEIDPSVQPAFPPDIAGFPTPEQWEALRQCEATGNYQAVNAAGIYFGAYQFWPDTWDSVAKRHYPRLLGVLPSNATPQDQTRMAYSLYGERGAQPWPVCGRHLRAGTEAGSSG